MRNLILMLTISILPMVCQGQIVHLNYPQQTNTGQSLEQLTGDGEQASATSDDPRSKTINWFSGGNVDFIAGGLMQATTRVMRINIGVPDSFYMPFYLMLGAVAEVNQSAAQQIDQTASQLLSANGGYLNMGLHGTHPISDNKPGDGTGFSWTYQLGAKQIIGEDPNGSNVNLLSGVGNLGLMFQTKAWTPEKPENIGMAWIQCSFASTLSDKEKIRQLYGPDTDPFFYGLQAEAGIEIANYVNLHAGYYRYFNNQGINDEFDKGIFKFSADFKISK